MQPKEMLHKVEGVAAMSSSTLPCDKFEKNSTDNMSDFVVFTRSDGKLMRIVAAVDDPQQEAQRMSYCQPFEVGVAAQVANVNRPAPTAVLDGNPVGADWYETSLPAVFTALAQVSQGTKRKAETLRDSKPDSELKAAPRARKPKAPAPEQPEANESEQPKASETEQPGASETGPPESQSDAEQPGDRQLWLEPCSTATAPKAKEVKAALRQQGAPQWVLALCREVSQRSEERIYRKILKLDSSAGRTKA